MESKSKKSQIIIVSNDFTDTQPNLKRKYDDIACIEGDPSSDLKKFCFNKEDLIIDSNKSTFIYLGFLKFFLRMIIIMNF